MKMRVFAGSVLVCLGAPAWACEFDGFGYGRFSPFGVMMHHQMPAMSEAENALEQNSSSDVVQLSADSTKAPVNVPSAGASAETSVKPARSVGPAKPAAEPMVSLNAKAQEHAPTLANFKD